MNIELSSLSQKQINKVGKRFRDAIHDENDFEDEDYEDEDDDFEYDENDDIEDVDYEEDKKYN